MRLKFLSEDTLQDLKLNLDAYITRYYTRDNSWFDEYLSKNDAVLESNLPFIIPELNFDTDYGISDRENIKILYESLKNLSPTHATDERIWAGLAHIQLREYTFYRLQDELKKKNSKRIKSALFYTQGQKRSLYVHIIARLWWVGYMTYDEKNSENPYWLTDFFAEKQFASRCILFFSSNFTSNREITKGLLSALYKINNLGIEIDREHFVESIRYLNVVGGALVLDVLTRNEIEELVFDYLKRKFNIDILMNVK